MTGVPAPETTGDWIALSGTPLPVERATAWATVPGAGAVVSFLGVVRDHSESRDNVVGLTYEAYERAATDALAAVATEARRRWPTVVRIALLHRTGALDVGEPAVVVVVSSPHRAEAFDAARFCIDTLKETVPIWKQEHWAGGSDWGLGAAPLRSVGGP